MAGGSRRGSMRVRRPPQSQIWSSSAPMTRVPHSWTWARSDIRKFLNWGVGFGAGDRGGPRLARCRVRRRALGGKAVAVSTRWRSEQTHGTDVVEGATRVRGLAERGRNRHRRARIRPPTSRCTPARQCRSALLVPAVTPAFGADVRC